MFEMIMEAVKNFLLLIGYVSGGGAVHKPLSDEEEQECIKRMQEGDAKAKNMLIILV